MVVAGEDVTERTIGEHDIRTDTAIIKKMHCAARSGHTGYGAISGIQVLREEIATRVPSATRAASDG